MFPQAGVALWSRPTPVQSSEIFASGKGNRVLGFYIETLANRARCAYSDTMDESVKNGLDELQRRGITAALDVATPQWWRAYWRAHNTKLEELMTRQIPQEVRGAGPLGEHVFKVVHSIRQSPLDLVEVKHPQTLEGEVIPQKESSG